MASYSPSIRRLIRYGTLALVVLAMVLLSHVSLSGLVGNGSALAQSTSVSFSRRLQNGELSAAVYQRLPDLPLENDYVNTRTGTVDPNNTLVNRVVRYHIYTKGRITEYRLDWKLTLADYLGANERMDEDRYPLARRMAVNPMENDQQAIASLNRAERDRLVRVLIEVCHPELATEQGDSPGSSSPEGDTNDGPEAPPPAGSGASDLLL